MSSSRVVRSAAAFLAAAVVGAGTTWPAAAEDPTRATGPGTYIVTLAEQPSALYAGGLPGHPATRARPGERFDHTRRRVTSYERWLVARQQAIVDRIGNPPVLYHYATAVNGFAAMLTGNQVKRLRKTRDVVLVEKSSKQSLDTVDTPRFLGLPETWQSVGGPDRAGRGTVVGVLDTGIWPENPAFAGLPQARPGISPGLPGFHGSCETGEQWQAGDCNDKVVSARYFVHGFGAENLAQSEVLSPRDSTGHGSHTASTAAGNDDVNVTIDGQDFGEASGMAPGARIAAYKVCWAAPNPDDDGCATPDSVAAVDQAVADGVDVISYAVSGRQESVADSVELAFLNATGAGVFVAASAGNRGPAAGTVGHPSPWVTTVGASSHRLRQGSIVLGDREVHVGAMVSDKAVPTTGIVLASQVATRGAGVAEARICEFGSLDPRKVQDRIVVCDRGTTARVDKSSAVARAGGAGMVLANAHPDSVEADFHAVPTVHVDAAAAEQIRAYVRRARRPTASIDPSGSEDADVPPIADFSARGPEPAAGGDVLKPDLVAPGVSVLAAVSPSSTGGRLWDFYSGTSVSTAHVAGLAALVAGAEPTWSPARIKSAMMTTAVDLDDTVRPLAHGAGKVDPTRFLDPGLVFEASTEDYLAFLAGQGFTRSDGSPVSDRPIDAIQLNLPSIAVGDLTRRARVTRKVTNVSGSAETFSARVTGLNGVTATVRPRTLELGPGESARFTVTFRTAGNARPGSYARGRLTWTGPTHEVRLPVVVEPELVAAPTEVTGAGESGALTVEGVAGTDRSVPLDVAGMAAATPVGVSLVPGGFDPAVPSADSDTERFPLTVPEGTDVARVEIDGHKAGDDMDLYVYRDGELVGSSAGDAADETATLISPKAGEYAVYVNSHSAANGSTTTGQLYSWVVPSVDADNVEVQRRDASGRAGQTFRYRLSWAGLPMTARWLGAVRYGGSDHRTLVSIR